ncbi:hypothetical protein TNCV_4996991 [Trichonephila clavipes]|nr:hypothetical protein TNCV_4996991 [Trichonephila clavipes]
MCQIFADLQYNLCKYRSLPVNRHSEERPRVTRTPNMVLGYLGTVSNTSCSTHGTKCVGYHDKVHKTEYFA